LRLAPKFQLPLQVRVPLRLLGLPRELRLAFQLRFPRQFRFPRHLRLALFLSELVLLSLVLGEFLLGELLLGELFLCELLLRPFPGQRRYVRGRDRFSDACGLARIFCRRSLQCVRRCLIHGPVLGLLQARRPR